MSDIQTQLARLLSTKAASSSNQRSTLPSIVPLKGLFLALAGLGLMGLGGCGLNANSPNGSQAKAAQQPTNNQPLSDGASGSGQLEIRANGEDFVRNGFTSKDGWAISFDYVYVGLAEVAALQTSFQVNSQAHSHQDNSQVKAQVTGKLEQSQLTVVDLASPAAPTALIAQFPQAPAGRYNGLSWRIAPADSGPSQGQSLQLVGQARQADRTIDFTLNWDGSYQYVCGDFIGDQRKGLLKGGDRADLEATFHFDHIFGDGDAPPEDELNQKALGFGPLAALSSTPQLSLNRQQLQIQLSSADFQRLETAIAGLAHVGEGHCEQISPLTQTQSQPVSWTEEVNS